MDRRRRGIVLWPLLVKRERLFGVAESQRLYEVCVLNVAEGTVQSMTVVAEEVQALMRMEQGLEAIVTLKIKI